MHQLLPDFEADPQDFRLYFDRSRVPALQEDENERADRVRQDAQAGLIDVRTWKEERGFEVFPGDDVYLRGFNVLPTPVGSRPPPSSNTPALRSRLKAALGFETKADLSPLQAGVIESLAREATRLTEVLEDELYPAFVQLGERASDAFLALEPAVAVASNGHGHKDDLTTIDGLLALFETKQSPETSSWFGR